METMCGEHDFTSGTDRADLMSLGCGWPPQPAVNSEAWSGRRKRHDSWPRMPKVHRRSVFSPLLCPLRRSTAFSHFAEPDAARQDQYSEWGRRSLGGRAGHLYAAGSIFSGRRGLVNPCYLSASLSVSLRLLRLCAPSDRLLWPPGRLRQSLRISESSGVPGVPGPL